MHAHSCIASHSHSAKIRQHVRHKVKGVKIAIYPNNAKIYLRLLRACIYCDVAYIHCLNIYCYVSSILLCLIRAKIARVDEVFKPGIVCAGPHFLEEREAPTTFCTRGLAFNQYMLERGELSE